MPRPVALITGPTSGLGAGYARRYARDGFDLVLVARDVARLDDLANELRASNGIDVEVLSADLADADGRARVAERLSRGVQILVNNAGFGTSGEFWTADPALLQAQLDVNVTAAFLLARALAPGMRARGYGRIVNVASIAGLVGTPSGLMDAVGYSTSKAALIGLTRDLAVKWAPDGITVNAVAPGFFRTRMSEAILDRHADAITASTPMARIGQEGELKGAVVFLASPAASYITGQILAVDGGTTAM